MHIIESIIWLFTPITLSLLIGSTLKINGVSIGKLAVTGIILGISGALFAPSVLSTSLHGKVVGALFYSVLVDLLLLIFVIYWFNSKSKKSV
jgi:hypothetical protein